MSRLPIGGYRAGDDAVLLGPAGAVGAAVFFAQAARLARALPQADHVINLCDTRHGFMLGFAAALLRGQVSLLPPGRATGEWEALLHRHPGAYSIREKPIAGAFAIGAYLEDRAAGVLGIPAIEASAIAAILFTSGSTGEPVAHAKTWGQLCRGAALLARALGWDAHPAAAIVGSVPPQHMFGLEATVMLPWQAGVPVHEREPLLAADVRASLDECGRPAWWMTTPMHLRAALQATPALGGLQGVVASTASLAPALAHAAEAAWKVTVVELYGSTETGALAMRRPAREVEWTPLPGVVLHAQGAGAAPAFRAEGPHIDIPVVLGDALTLLPDGRFLWLGRASDMVKVGGKRASLSALNVALTGIPGVVDGVFVFPQEAEVREPESRSAPRLAAYFVSDALDAPQVLAALRLRIDPAFLPRPLYRVARLPRNANGKLPQSALAELIAQCQPAQAVAYDHPALPGHFPGDERVPGVTLLARVAEALRARFPASVPGELLHARFHIALRPGEPFAIAARREQGLARFEVRRAPHEGSAAAVGSAEPGAMIASGDWALHDADRGESRP